MRTLKQRDIEGELVVVGGGLSGVCCAITAARQGIRVVLVQDRPVLGGNASSEVRLWVLGATSHMGNNNRWAREGGVIDELLVENVFRNPEGNAVLFDALLLEAVNREMNITLLLNTAVHELDLEGERIARVRAFNSQNQTFYSLSAPLFVDASGDGILGFLAGAEFRMGAEARSEFHEAMAPIQEQQTLLGHSLYFYSRDVGRPVQYVPPAFALQDIKRIPRFRDLRVSDTGCRLWWLEFGGALDTVGQTEEIKWELWSVAYGVWNYIKNSGEFPEAENLTLEWMGTIPGKRESRRFIGDVILTQRDIVEQNRFPDAVSFGGWAIDLHPSDGVFSEKPGCIQYHSKGVYQIPYRCMYSRNVDNLFLTGRLISATHIAFASTRVMATCASNAQAVGMAAVLCTERGLLPRDLVPPERMRILQERLLAAGQHIPGVLFHAAGDHARSAILSATSSLRLRHCPASEPATVVRPYALLLPLVTGPMPRITLYADVSLLTTVRAELWGSKRIGNTTPDLHLSDIEVAVEPGRQIAIALQFPVTITQNAHHFLIIPPQDGVQLFFSDLELPGILVVSQKMNGAVAKSLVQTPPEDSGIDTFAFWLPERRPGPRNLAATFEPALDLYRPENVINGLNRPWCGANAWVPDPEDKAPVLTLRWNEPKVLREIHLTFDTDFDHPMESVLMNHPERVMPGCVTAFRIFTAEGEVLADVSRHHQTLWSVKLPDPVTTTALSIEIRGHGSAPPAIFNVSCF